MDLDAVAAELGDALRTIEGLRVPEWGVQRVHPPFALIPLPERIAYDVTYGRGSDRIEDWPLLVLVANPTQPAARRLVAEYAAGSGELSVKAAIEKHAYNSCDEVVVTAAEFDVVSYAGTDYLAAQFSLEITGRGA